MLYSPAGRGKYYIMVRKIILLLLLIISLHNVVNAQTLDAVTISIPPYTDTTCPGTQLMFTAMQSVDTFSTTTYAWFTDGVFTGITIDTFYTTALVDGDNVYCQITYTNSAGVQTAVSNTIVIHRSTSIPPGVVVALTSGSNPYCTLTPLTFTAFPINGGSAPAFQWIVDGVPMLGEDSSTVTSLFAFGDTVSVRVISNSACSAPYNDTVYSIGVPIIHDSLTAGITVTVTKNPICAGALDTFTALVTSPGIGYTLSWYVDSSIVPSAIGPVFITDSLHDGSLVYCELTAPDPCITNHTTVSNIITITVIPNLNTSVSSLLTRGSNPGCLDSLVQFTGTYVNFGTAPNLIWYVNGLPVETGSNILDTFFANGDTVTFTVNETDNRCYTHDTLSSLPFLMIRDSTPEQPLVSLIGDLLETNSGGYFTWYYDSAIIPGANGQIFHPGTLGFYYAVKDTGNCPSLASNVIYISLLSVNNLTAADVSIYPNPTSGILNIDWAKQVDHMDIDIFDVVGQNELHGEAIGQSHAQADLSGLPEGNYFIVLRDQDGSKATFKVLLTR